MAVGSAVVGIVVVRWVGDSVGSFDSVVGD